MNKKVVLSVLSTAVVASMATAAFAKPSTGLYIGGSVDKYYSITQFLNNEDQVIEEINNTGFGDVLYVDDQGKAATIGEVVSADDLDDVLETATLEDFKGNTYAKADGTTYDPSTDSDLTGAPAGDLKVESVSAINAKQIEVKFDSKVDADSAEDLDNYFVQTNSTPATDLTTLDATADVAVQADGKTVIITTTADIETQFSVNAGTPFKLVVDGVTNEAGSAAPKFEQVLTVKDTTAPTYLSASASGKTGTTSITLKFSEPVDPTSGLVKVNGASTSVAAGSKPNELTVTTTSTLLAGQTYNLSIIDFKDYAGNLLANVDATVTVAGDVVAPTITAVKPVGDHKVEITFDKDMDVNTVNTNNIRLLDANSTNLSANLVTLLPVGTSKKVFTLTLGGTLYSGNTFSATLVLTDSIMDAAGNKAATTSKPVTLTKDTTKPVASSIKFIKADATPLATYGGVAIANGALVVNYSEAVALTAGAGALTGVKVINNKGADVTANYITAVELGAAAVHPDKDTEVIIPLANAVTTDTALTLRLPGGLVEDDALVKNTDGASVNTVAVSGGSNVTDTQVPVIASATGVLAGAANVITVAVTEANDLDEATVLNLNNYRVDGAPLPTGTYVELDSTGAPNHVIKINLPAGTTAKSKNYSVNVSGIKDKAGNTAKTVAFNTVALNDDVAPVLTGGKINTDGTASLSFSENVVGAVVADFVVTINGLELTDPAAYSVAAVTSGADAGKYLLTVTALVDNGADATAGTADDFLYIDADNSTGFNAGDIKLQTGSTVAAGNVDLNSAFVNSVKVATASTGLTGADAAGNVLKADVPVSVK